MCVRMRGASVWKLIFVQSASEVLFVSMQMVCWSRNDNKNKSWQQVSKRQVAVYERESARYAKLLIFNCMLNCPTEYRTAALQTWSFGK